MKNPQRVLLLILLFPLLLICTGCPKEPVEPKEVPLLEIKQDVLDFACYKQGSWWHYEDSATGHEAQHTVLEDTFYVDDIIDGSFHNPEHVANQEVFSFSIAGWRTVLEFKSIALGSSAWYGKKVGSEGRGSLYFVHDYRIPYESRTTDPDTIRQHFLDSMLVNGKVFHKVVRVQNTQNPVHLGAPETFLYLAKNNGIIRWEFHWKNHHEDLDSSQIWNLVDHQVVQ